MRGFFLRHHKRVRDILDVPLLRVSKQDVWTIRDACEGALILGGTGSGKTSGPGFAYARALLAAGFGGLVLTAKPDEAALWRAHAEATGRTASLCVLSPSSGHRFNFLADTLRRTPAGSQTESLVSLMTVAADAADRGTGVSQGGGSGQDPYWGRAMKQLLRNAFDVLRLADKEITVGAVVRLINDAPQSVAQIGDPAFVRSSFVLRCLQTADMLCDSDLDRGDLDATARFWLREFPSLASRTRSSVISTFTSMADGLLRGDLRELLSTTSTIKPEMLEQGMVLVVDLPVKVHGDAGRVAQTVIKHVVQTSLESRDVTTSPRPVFLWMDEAQNFLSGTDHTFLATARSSRAATVMITQSIPGLIAATGGREARSTSESLISNLRTKVLCANDCPVTNEWAERLFAKAWQTRVSTSLQDRQPANNQHHGTQHSAGSSAQQSLDPEVLAREFHALRCGGSRHDHAVDCLWFQGGRVFRATSKNYVRLTFRQQPA